MNIYKKVFILGVSDKKEAKVYYAFGISANGVLNKDIFNVQHIIGCNFIWNANVFKQHLFDENLQRYCWAEDTDFSYRVFLDNKNALILNSNAKLKHYMVPISRIKNKQKIVMMYDYFTYFYFKILIIL